MMRSEKFNPMQRNTTKVGEKEPERGPTTAPVILLPRRVFALA
jgi:hypothetical protein